MFNNKIEALVNLYTVDNGELKILLFKKMDDPFKGYWMLPSNLMINKETIEECAEATINEKLGVSDVYTEPGIITTQIDRIPDTRIVGISMIAIIDTVKLNLNIEESEEYEWFNVDNIPKTIYDHGEIIKKTTDLFKTKLLNTKYLRKFFPSDFTMPELQKLFEQLLGKEIDRRNFRKKLLSLDIIENTNEKNVSMSGRPATLYSFKETDDKNVYYE